MEGADVVTVFLVDDHPLVREGLRATLERGGMRVVGEADSVGGATARLPSSGCRVAIVDLHLPDGSGVEVSRVVAQRCPDARSLVFTSEIDDIALLDAVLAGADGYVLKQAGTAELLDAVAKVARGEPLLGERSRQQVVDRARRGATDEQVALLTPQERTLLDHLADGLSNRDIAARMHLSEKTVKNYMSNLLLKLGAQRRTEAAVLGAQARARQEAAHRPADRLPSAIRY